MHTINVVGIGPGDLNQWPPEIHQAMREADSVFVKTEQMPAIEELKALGAAVSSFDYLYKDDNESLAATHQVIADRLIEAAEEGEVLYAVPGHPRLAEKTVNMLMDRHPKISILGGKSMVDDLLQAVGCDPLAGFQLFDSAELNPDDLNTGQPVLIVQLINASTAAEVKRYLMQKYPEGHTVALVDAAGSRQEKVEWTPLSNIDTFKGIHHLKSLYIPPLERDERVTSLSTLQHYIDQVTDPEKGDAWLHQQTPRSLIRYLREETEEVVEAIENDDSENWMEELGDVLVQLLYQTSKAEKEGAFTFENVLETVNRKIRRRHPHVFDGVKADTAEEVDALWQKIKAQEKREKDET